MPSIYLSKFQGNFQSNYFIAHFLYKRAEISPPDYESYSYVEYYTKMREYVRNDQFLGLEGRFDAICSEICAIEINNSTETV